MDIGREVHDLFEQLRAASAALVGTTIPLIGRHRRLDASDAGADVHCDLPLLELDDAITTWLRTASPGSAIPSSLWTQSPEAITDLQDRRAHSAARSVVSAYCRALDVDERFIPILVVCNAVAHVVRDIDRSGPAASHDIVALLASRSTELFTVGNPTAASKTRRRVGIISPFPLSETGHGAPAAIRGAVHALSHHNDVEVISSAREPRGDDAPPTEHDYHEILRPSHRHRARRLRLVVGMVRGRPPWAIEWNSSELTDQMVSLIDRSDITHIEFIVMADQIPRGHQARHPVIVVDHNPPIVGALIQLRRDPWWFRPYRLLEIQAWARTERRAGKLATVIVVFAPEDKQIVERFVRTTPVIVAPLTIELPPQALDPIGSGPPTLAFVGSYRRPPNQNALRVLVEQVMPLVWSQRDDVCLRVIGPEPPDFVIDVDERITATGFVDDFSAALDDVAVVVAPIALGRGMRIKVLEMLAYGKAVVTTTRGAAGFPTAAKNCMIVVDGNPDIAAAVVELLDDPERRHRLATEGRAWAENWLHVQCAADRYQDLHDLVDALQAGETE